jgi:CRP-like cAMP-binding protein
MGKLIGILVSTWHWLACCYWGVAVLEHGMLSSSRYGEDTWSPPPQVAQANDLGTQYSFAFFWAVVVTSGIGWDIIPTSPVQVIFTTIAIVTGLLIYAIIIGSASSLLASLDTAASARRSKMQEIKHLMRNRHVPKSLSAEIFDFYEYLLSCNSGAIDEYSVLSDLPQSLRSKLNIAINRQIMKSIPLFENCSDAAMAALIEQLYQLVILPGEYVMEQGTIGHEMYFVVRGKLQVLRDTDTGYRVMLANRGEGDFFGEISLFEDAVRSASVKAITYCDLLTLPREGFEFIQLHFPKISATLAHAATRRMRTIDDVLEIETLASTTVDKATEGGDSGGGEGRSAGGGGENMKSEFEEGKEEKDEEGPDGTRPGEVGDAKVRRGGKTKVVPTVRKEEEDLTGSEKFRELVLNVEEDNSFRPLVLSEKSGAG